MFESSDDVMPVAAQGAMIAVMQHDNIAMRLVWARNASEPLDQSLRRLRLPVPANFRPHNDAPHSRAKYFAAEQWTPITVWRPHPARCSGHSSGNRNLASQQLILDCSPRLKNQVCMRLRVIPNQVATGRHFLNQTGTFPHKFPDHKKCRRNGVAIEQVEKSRSDGWIGTIIKRKGDFFRRRRVMQGRSVQFRRRSNSPPRGNTRRSYRTCRNDDRPWIQCVSKVNLRTATHGVLAALLVSSREP